MFDGIVFDSPLISYMSSMDADFLEFLVQISRILHEYDRLFITSLMVILLIFYLFIKNIGVK